jgi:signal peptidase I
VGIQRDDTFKGLLVAVVTLFALCGTLAWTDPASAEGHPTSTMFVIASAAMEPTLPIGARVDVYRLAYRHNAVERGDIVVFRRPANEDCGGAPVKDLVKRVIGLPGETISLRSGRVVIDAKVLNESWLSAKEQGITFQGPDGEPYNLG